MSMPTMSLAVSITLASMPASCSSVTVDTHVPLSPQVMPRSMHSWLSVHGTPIVVQPVVATAHELARKIRSETVWCGTNPKRAVRSMTTAGWPA